MKYSLLEEGMSFHHLVQETRRFVHEALNQIREVNERQQTSQNEIIPAHLEGSELETDCHEHTSGAWFLRENIKRLLCTYPLHMCVSNKKLNNGMFYRQEKWFLLH
jgi:hypothetical protein